MDINIQARGFSLTKALRDHAERRLRFALGWADDRLRRISVRLSDENGPRGGEDKRCRIRIAFAGAPSVVIEDTETDVYVAIDRAADRAGRSVARRLERQRNQHRRLLPTLASVESLTWAWR
ncbi:MAG TPA: HPF/RaiA family ribosome-associated protein [Candidatus Competibacter sp.]|nr:30S ribosomal protein S30 [Candidatus Competibacteraceae bacterium]HRE54133.1 HPF/RaiA family ribosome-associated protein [Candidatus Competibacter sp.]HUM94881.1 HPF/RaiA family ribosome-associated protein [Candidatus Competibacter sp.]